MQARLDALEYENSQLRANAELGEDNSKRIENLLADQKHTASRIAELESLVRTTERTVSERDSTIEALERAAQQMTLDIEKARGDAEARVRDIQSKLDDRDALVTNLKDALQTKEGLQSENDAVLRAKDAEIALLEARVQKAYNDLEDERRELGGQVEELRRAGQVRLTVIWIAHTDGSRRKPSHCMRSALVPQTPDGTSSKTQLRIWKSSYAHRLSHCLRFPHSDRPPLPQRSTMKASVNKCSISRSELGRLRISSKRRTRPLTGKRRQFARE